MDGRKGTVKTVELLRKKDLHPAVGIAKSTVADWIEDFNIYIPKIKQGSVIYYRPETIEVLLFIKKSREQHFQKHQIMEMLSEKGFSITVEDAVDDVKRALSNEGNPRDNLIAIMQTTAQAITKIAEQDERLDKQEGSLKSLQDNQLLLIEGLAQMEIKAREVEFLKKEFEQLNKELAITKQELEEQKGKGFFSRLFRK